jgi:Family of unknown function (DUF6491)
MLRTVLLAAASLLLCACATKPTETAAATPPTGRDCFFADNITGYGYVDENHVSVTVGPSRKYLLTTMFNARELDWTTAIALHSTTNWICTGSGLGTVDVIGGHPRRTFPISAIERAPDETPPAQGS